MKRLRVYLVTLAMVLLFCIVPVKAKEHEKFQIGENVWCTIQNKDHNGTYTVVLTGTGSTYDFLKDGYDKSGKHKNFYTQTNCRYINLIVEEGITRIGDYTFSLSVIREFKMPKSLNEIGIYALYFSSYFKGINIDEWPNNLKVDEKNQLFIKYKPGFETLPVEEFGNDTFYYIIDETISEIKINSITKRILSIPEGLKSIITPPSVTYIAPDAIWRGDLDTIIIKGYTNSYAESYAKKYKITFESIGICEPHVDDIYVVDGLKYKIKTDTTVELLGFDSSKSVLKIPNTIQVYNKTFKVTSIANNAFNDKKYKIVSVSIGNNVTAIGSRAFYNSNLTGTLVIPKNVTTIGKEAFYKSKLIDCIKISGTKLKKVGSKALCISKSTILTPKSKYKAYKKLIDKSGIAKNQKYKTF